MVHTRLHGQRNFATYLNPNGLTPRESSIPVAYVTALGMTLLFIRRHKRMRCISTAHTLANNAHADDVFSLKTNSSQRLETLRKLIPSSMSSRLRRRDRISKDGKRNWYRNC
jgi:hypothetical protein